MLFCILCSLEICLLVRYVWYVYHVLLGRTFVFGLCTKNLKNLKTFFKNLGSFQPCQNYRVCSICERVTWALERELDGVKSAGNTGNACIIQIKKQQ